MALTPDKLAEAGTEMAHQQALFLSLSIDRARGAYPETEWLFHIPNGGQRGAVTAARFKAGGVKPGVPDLFLPAPKRPYFGLWLELKKPGEGKGTSEHQDRWLGHLAKQGYAVAVADNWQAARLIIHSYLDGRHGHGTGG